MLKPISFALATLMASSASLAADAPKAKGTRDKITVGVRKSYDAAESLKLWGGYFEHLGKCANVDVINKEGKNVMSQFSIDLMEEKELVDGMNSGKVQLGVYSPGLVPQIIGKGEPFVVPGKIATGEKITYTLILVVKNDSPYKTPKDLIGKKIAHTTPSSNSGNLAPRALFPALGLTPEKDYEVVFSKGHDRSVMGTHYGFWQGAAVASDLYQRMLIQKEIGANDVRVIWESPPFITESWVMSKSVPADVQERVKKCSYEYAFTDHMKKLLKGTDHFLPVSYDKDFATVREVWEKTKNYVPKK